MSPYLPSPFFADVLLLRHRGWALLERLGGIVTFGQPRTGDAAYAESFEGRFGGCCLRYVCGCDMVRTDS